MTQKIHILFCHGWAYDNSLFDVLISKIHQIIQIKNKNHIQRQKINITNIDLGFLHTNNNDQKQNHNENTYIKNLSFDKDTKYIWVGHSYGLIYGLLYYENFIHTYLGINPVLSFPDKVYLKGIYQQIQKGYILKVIKDFYSYIQDTSDKIYHILNALNTYSLNKYFILRAIQDMLDFNPQIYLDILHKNKSLHLYHNINDVFILDTVVIEKINNIPNTNIHNIFSIKTSNSQQCPHASPLYDTDACAQWLLAHI